MTEGVASADQGCVDAIPATQGANLCWGVRAVADDDWLIFLDVARNRYRAVRKDIAPPISGLSSVYSLVDEDRSSGWLALADLGLVSRPPSSALAPAALELADAKISDVCALIPIALWARTVVRRGALMRAFSELSMAKARTAHRRDSLAQAQRAYARFAAARIWVPARYVCLFDSLSLMRFLLSEGIAAELVFGVRGRPFAAHCWVECEGELLDDGGEACASFKEIVRI